MGIIEIIMTSFGLAMDAFATSICKGLSMRHINLKKCLVVGLYFGIFQGLMPLLGYILGNTFGNFIVMIDHWIIFILLSIIGFNMLHSAFTNNTELENEDINLKNMLPLALATSIDALAVGITFSFLKVDIVLAVLLISIITFILSFIGVLVGNEFGNKYEKKAQILGGIILIIIGIKILLEHLNIL